MVQLLLLILFSQPIFAQDEILHDQTLKPIDLNLNINDLKQLKKKPTPIPTPISKTKSPPIQEPKTEEELEEDNFQFSDYIPDYFQRNKTDYLDLPGEYKLFYFLPNAFSMKPFQRKFLDTEGSIRSNSVDSSTPDKSAFRPFNVWSIGHLLYPKKRWSWHPYFSPSLNYFSWKDPGHIRFLHLIYSLKLVWHMPEGWGSLKAAIGLGPMWIDGEIFGIRESNTVAIMPRTQLAWHRFLYKRLFLQVKFSKHYLWKNVFNEGNFRVRSISTTGIYFGYNFSTHY